MTTKKPSTSCSISGLATMRWPGDRLDKKDATITAAGATVAVIGTAAIVRQVRKRRRGS